MQTVLFADYVGYGYLIWVLLIGGTLFDLAFNKGRVVGSVLEAAGTMVGGLPAL